MKKEESATPSQNTWIEKLADFCINELGFEEDNSRIGRSFAYVPGRHVALEEAAPESKAAKRKPITIRERLLSRRPIEDLLRERLPYLNDSQRKSVEASLEHWAKRKPLSAEEMAAQVKRVMEGAKKMEEEESSKDSKPTSGKEKDKS